MHHWGDFQDVWMKGNNSIIGEGDTYFIHIDWIKVALSVSGVRFDDARQYEPWSK
jgi:hypothetical protein